MGVHEPLPHGGRYTVPKVKAETKLKNAAHATVCSGVRTRVDTIVAMEFAES